MFQGKFNINRMRQNTFYFQDYICKNIEVDEKFDDYVIVSNLL